MAVLTNKSIASTYKSVLSIGATTESALTTSIQQLTDGLGNSSPLSMSTTQIQFNNDANTFSFPADRGTSGQILKLADANGTLSWADDDLSNTLDFSGGTGTGSVTLDTQTLAFTGTANQIVTSASSQAITLSFPTAGVTLPDGSVATTQTASDNSTKVATTAYVDNQVSTAGTVTSVALSVPTGLTVTNSPITTSGTIALNYTSGYSIPTDAKQTQWDTAYDYRITTATSPLSISALSNTISLGTVGVANGGTGATTLTGILVGNGTSAISSVTDGTVSGQVLSTNANGTYSFIDAAGGDVSISGTPSTNEVAIWTNSNTIKGDASFQFLTGAQNSIKLIRGTGAGNILFYAADGTTLHGYIENQVSGNGLTIGQRDGSTSAVIDLDDSTITFKTNNNPHLTISSVGDATFSGNVGIGTGTATPSQRLEVRKDDGVGSGLHGITDFNRAGGVDAQLLIGYYANGTSVTESTIYSANDMPLSLATGGSQRLTISSGGDVNIGTADGLPLMHGSVAGNASYCTYSFVNDPNTGMIRTGADTLALVTAGSPKLTISSGGNVGIGVSALSAERLTVDGMTSGNTTFSMLARNSSLTTSFWIRDNGDGYLRANAWIYGSDLRLKENISDVENGIDMVSKMKPKHFDYIDGSKDNLGFIAQDVQKIIPQAVSITDQEKGTLGLKTDFLVPYLVKAIQEQQTIIEDLKLRIETLEG